MKQVFNQFIGHKEFYFLSISVGTVVSSIITFLSTIHERYFLGVTVSLWLIAFIINVFDIHTGIKADTVTSKKEGKNFVFKSGKAWRAFEKIIIFTLLIWFLWTLEKEILRLEFFNFLITIVTGVKFILFVYVMLIELQSIGENEETRFGKKSKLFVLLDKIIDVVNEGIINKIKKTIE